MTPRRSGPTAQGLARSLVDARPTGSSTSSPASGTPSSPSTRWSPTTPPWPRPSASGSPTRSAEPEPRSFSIPVCYGGEHGPDLDDVAEVLDLTPDEVIALHTAQPFVLRFVGSPVTALFVEIPDLPAEIPRVASPGSGSPPGSVALSGRQSMIYPVPSPGGWRLIGRTPLRLFDVADPDLVPYRTGDLVRFVAIGADEWDDHAGRRPAARRMNVTTLTVEQPGLTTVQDLGRPGYGRLGVAANGAADRYAAAVASALVANDAHDPLLEVTATGFSFSVDRPSLVAVTGAAEEVEVDGAAQPVWQTLAVPAGARVAVAEPRRGLRSYVAVGGRLRAEPTLGSVAPDPLLEVGPRLDAGETLEVATGYAGLDHPHTVIPVFRFRVDRPALSHDWSIDVTPGPDTTEFGDDVLADGCVRGRSRVGLRRAAADRVDARPGSAAARSCPAAYPSAPSRSRPPAACWRCCADGC